MTDTTEDAFLSEWQDTIHWPLFEHGAYLVKELLMERSSKMSFLELPLLVMFIESRISCKAVVQLLPGIKSAPNVPVPQSCLSHQESHAVLKQPHC